MSLATPSSTIPSPCPTCSQAYCSPGCDKAAGYICKASVIGALCQCPVASCINETADPANNNNDTPSPHKSIVGPVVGSIAALIVIGAVVIFLLRRRRRQRLRLIHSSSVMLNQEDYLESFSKRWHGSTGSELEGHKDVIRIAYIPSMISESSLNIPEPSNNRNGASKSQFNSLKDEDRKKKHDSAILDEAVVMGVSHKATAQVMKLNNLKATKSDLIQRSNSLHSSNSIKRSKSQRRVDAAAGRTAGTRVRSPLGGNMSASDSDQEESGSDGASTAIHTTTTTRRRSGQPSSSDKDPSNPFMSEAELISFGPSTSTATKCSNRSSNPFLSASESMAGSTAPSPVFTSMAISLAGDDLLSSPISALESANLRPWTTSSSTTLRDSTFSTASDSRSSTRGDGEEIMIFWDGHRDSKASNL